MNNRVVMPLLFNKGDTSYPIKKGRPVRGDDTAERRWQRRQLEERLAKGSAPKTEEQKSIIEPRPFDGIKDIKEINPDNYFYLSQYIRKNLHPSEEIEKPVLSFIINMFLNLPDNFYAPGKNYSRNEREFTREQLNVFRNSLSALEILCGEYNFGNSIGNFSNKQTYKLENLGGLLHTEIWDGKGSYHIIYVAHPSNIAPNDTDEELLKNLDPNLYENWKAVEKYLSSSTLSNVIEEGIKFRQKLPDEKIIIITLSKKLKEKSVLILEGSEIKEIPGLKLIDSYDNVSLYQRL